MLFNVFLEISFAKTFGGVFMSTLSVRLTELRKKKGLTQKNLADFLGIAPVSWQRFEYGTSKPKLENIIALSDYFDVSIDYLVGRTDNPVVNH